ncbi:formylglycine-generating enzyme family protein [Flavobacteriales bacterium]|nr:formylglycine-generating enzyme family protein [Flavobacteriales bacterium]
MNKDQNHIDNLFDKARDQQPETSFEETSGQFLNDLEAGKTSSLNQGVAKSFNFKNWIMLSFVIVAVISTVIYFNSNTPVDKEEIIVSIEEEVVNNPIETIVVQNEDFVVESITIEEEFIQITTSVYNNQISDSIVVSTDSIKDANQPVYILENIPFFNRMQDSAYRFPKLTEEQIENNYKQKKKMLKQLNKLDKKKYAYIPSGSFSFKGESISMQAFHMQTTEVTVLEYRTFIFDLLIQDRKEEFLKAKPDQEQWKFIMGNQQSSMQPMVDNYFSHSAYNQYPINNISREGAEMYCKWLTIEASKVRKDKKQVLNDVRLPSDYEWMFSAKGGEDNMESFPWKTSSIRNKKNCYLANYKPRTDSIFNSEKGEYEKCPGGCNIFYADGAFHTAKVDSYLPNEYGLYCMSGNAAEMVINWKDKTPGTKGGSWISDLPELMIAGGDKNSGVTAAKAHIGFRVVVTYILE